MGQDDLCKSANRATQGALELLLRARVAAEGGLSFADFMEASLYHPSLGYYTRARSPWGAQGDYLTAPQAHPAPGRAIARLAAEIDAALGAPEQATLIEVGSGDGRLLATVLATLRDSVPDLWRRLRVWSVERGPQARRQQADRLPHPPGGLRWADSLQDVTRQERRGGANGLLYSNELLDAFPVERVMRRGGDLLQSFVELRHGRLVEVFRAPASRAIAAHLDANGIRLREGQVAEVALGVEPWVRQVGRLLGAGGALTLDYGRETAVLYGESRHRGSLVCRHRYRLDDEPLLTPGDKDITAHVDFGNLRRAGSAVGLADAGLCSLRVFLVGMEVATHVEGQLADHLGLRHLLVSEIADAHSAMLQTRGLPPEAVGFGRARLDRLAATTGSP